MENGNSCSVTVGFNDIPAIITEIIVITMAEARITVDKNNFPFFIMKVLSSAYKVYSNTARITSITGAVNGMKNPSFLKPLRRKAKAAATEKGMIVGTHK